MAETEFSGGFAAGTFLRRLQAPVRDKLLDLGVTVRFRAGHTLIRQGDDDRSVFLLLRSVTKVTARAENGVETLLAVRVSGDIVGEMAPLGETERLANVITCGESTVNVIKGPVFLDFLGRHAGAAVALAQLIGDRLRWADQRRLEFAGYSAVICLARLLLTLARHHGVRTREGLDVGVALTQAELGGLIGAKEATVQKAMRGLRNDGLVRSFQQRIVITDVKALARFAELDPD
ncbi:Crp/Fnr family transcriptional regulator [Nonomuraea pusilla]|uniref:Crp/Fnr family transcriptional regulator n=1 Tax=Nonomuraea pusilla TaxID=46177 RepID=UPI0033259594